MKNNNVGQANISTNECYPSSQQKLTSYKGEYIQIIFNELKKKFRDVKNADKNQILGYSNNTN